jgi:hypothetical protein
MRRRGHRQPHRCASSDGSASTLPQLHSELAGMASHATLLPKTLNPDTPPPCLPTVWAHRPGQGSAAGTQPRHWTTILQIPESLDGDWRHFQGGGWPASAVPRRAADNAARHHPDSDAVCHVRRGGMHFLACVSSWVEGFVAGRRRPSLNAGPLVRGRGAWVEPTTFTQVPLPLRSVRSSTCSWAGSCCRRASPPTWWRASRRASQSPRPPTR